MEIEKAKEYLKQFSELMEKWGATEISSNIETILQALNNSISKEKIKTEIKSKMKNLWVDTCAEDSGKYTAYMSILNLLEE